MGTQAAPVIAGGPTDGLWDIRQASRYLSMSVSWVYKRCEAGLLPHVRMGGKLRFDPRELRHWVEQKGTCRQPRLGRV